MSAASDLTAWSLARRQRRTAAGVPGDGDASPCDPVALREAMARIGAGVHVATSAWNGRRYGITVTAACSLSAEPPSVLVSINRAASIYPAVLRSGVLCLNVLSAEQEAIARHFGGDCPPHQDRFAAHDWTAAPSGAPALSRAAATLDTKVEATMSFGSHTAFACSVAAIVLGDTAGGLFYVDRRYTHLTPTGSWQTHQV